MSLPNGHNLMDLYTGELISWTAKMITPCEMTRDIVRGVEAMAKKQGVRSLKFKYPEDLNWLPVCIDQEYDQSSDDDQDDEGGTDGGPIGSECVAERHGVSHAKALAVSFFLSSLRSLYVG